MCQKHKQTFTYFMIFSVQTSILRQRLKKNYYEKAKRKQCILVRTYSLQTSITEANRSENLTTKSLILKEHI